MVSKVAVIDPNLEVETAISKEGMIFRNVEEKPFKIYGIFRENGKYRRMPEKVALSVSEGVHFHHADTAGGRVRFKTDSKRIAIIAKMDKVGRWSQFAFTGSAGFDIYGDNMYMLCFVPPFEMESGYESCIELETGELREITIHFPLYNGVSELYIGVDEGALLAEASEYKIKKPVVYYGSSITQGGCASRPGNAYENIVTRKLMCDHINLGFSGSARAEDEMIEYIRNLDMSVFVYDYDHNAPDIDHLKNTHEKMFNAIRETNPNLPVIIMSRPKVALLEEEKERLAIIRETYNKAVAKGDKNVYFIEGKKLLEISGDDGIVDHCHPTDYGFFSMAEAISKVMAKIFKEHK